MTEIEREVTRKKETTKTVLTCDFCGIPEVSLPDDENIFRLRDEMDFGLTHVLICPDGTEKTFSTAHEAKIHAQSLSDDYLQRCQKKTRVSAECEINVEVCEHCIETLFSAADGMIDRETEKQKSGNNGNVGTTLGNGKPPKRLRPDYQINPEYEKQSYDGSTFGSGESPTIGKERYNHKSFK